MAHQLVIVCKLDCKANVQATNDMLHGSSGWPTTCARRLLCNEHSCTSWGSSVGPVPPALLRPCPLHCPEATALAALLLLEGRPQLLPLVHCPASHAEAS